MTDVQDDRRSALDNFAAAGPREVMAAPSVAPMVSPGDRVFGAQQVAVHRDEARILQKLSALGAAAGDDWFYRFPVRKKIKNPESGRDEWGADWIEGASIKLANDVARIYGNCEVDTRVIDIGTSWIIYARFTDFETGFSLTRPFQQDKGAAKLGGKDDARRLDIAFQIGVSKAIRNVVVNALQTFSDHAFNAARNSLVDRIGKDLVKWRERTLQGLAKHEVDVARVEAVIGRSSRDWTAPDVAKIVAMMKAIADGMATLDETFPPRHPDQNAASTSERSPSGDETAAAQSENEQPESTGNTASTQQPPAAATGQAAPEKAPPKGSKGAATPASGGFVPTTEAQYVAHANAWIDKLVDASEGEKQWGAEKGLRNKCNVSSDERDALRAALTKRIADIHDADRS